MEEVEIRDSSSSDSDEIRKLIQDLANYEKVPERPMVDAQTLSADGFGKDIFFKCFVGETKVSGKLIGYAMYYFCVLWTGLGVFMEDLYVMPEYRSKGVGTKLWKAVIEAGLSKGAQSCRFSVLNWNTPSLDYYKRKGAFSLTDGENGLQLYRFTLEAMKKVADAANNMSPNIVITRGNVQDISAVMNMFSELSLTLKDNILYEDLQVGFSQMTPSCFIFNAKTSDNAIIGFVMFYFSYSSWRGRAIYIQTIFVDEKYRKKNIGSNLLQEVFQFSRSKNCNECDVLINKSFESGVSFLKKHESVNMTKKEGYLSMCLTREHMEKLVLP